MIDVKVSTVINRPVADILAFVANFENHPRKNNVDHLKRLLEVDVTRPESGS